jgi:predicted esterase
MNSATPLGFDHRYIPGEGELADLTLLLLHGTGGDGDSLLQLGYTLAPGATLLSPTGKVKEGDSNRFFRRLAEGVFDQEDLALRTEELADFVRDAADVYQFDPRRVVAVGYSNGANIAASLVLRAPYVLAGAVLLRPMVPFTPTVTPRLHHMPLLLCTGALDAISPDTEGEQLAAIFRAGEADVTLHVERAGHELAMGDVVAAKEWVRKHFAPVARAER